MDDATIAAVVAEIRPLLAGRSAGKIFQTTAQSLAIDFGLRGDGYLFISVEPAQPRIYLIKRRFRDLEKQSLPLGQFGLSLRKELAGTTVSLVEKNRVDRIVWLKFKGIDEVGAQKHRSLVAQLTGRSSNLLLLDEQNQILAQLREGQGDGQTIGEDYQSPPVPNTETKLPVFAVPEGDNSISESLDQHYLAQTAKQASESRLAAARAQLRKETSRRKKLLKQLANDLQAHDGAENQKRIGDLLLANISTAKRRGKVILLTDYFDDNAPAIEIDIDENLTLAEEASRRFESFARSKRARKQILARIETVKAELAQLEAQSIELESNPQAATAPDVKKRPGNKRTSESSQKKIPGTRRYFSSDGYEILVGRTARDNDHLTFKIAAPNDLWLHAADYPGSHVVVRNSTRKDIPHRTLVEAAQLAGYFSQTKKDPKVDIHYTQRKFVSKIKGAAPGLVRLLRFKTIIVAPRESGERIK
jgi:predicted ribosome quality control (RQC) complex YloA/Tae2 family protein